MTAIPFIHTAPALDAAMGAYRAVTLAGTAAGELVTAGALLWALNGTAGAIRTTYRAGAATRRLVDATLVPAADAISWAIAQVDWAETARTIWACALTVGVAAYVAGEATGRAFHAWHTAWVGAIDWAAPAPAPAPEPIACTYEGLTVVQLRKLARVKAKGVHLMRKAELLALLA